MRVASGGEAPSGTFAVPGLRRLELVGWLLPSWKDDQVLG